MDDMIERIIELDKEARENLTKAKQLQVESEQKISNLKEQKRTDYISRARADIKELEKDEKVKAYVKLSVIENFYRKKTQRIEKIYFENKEKWINTIVQRIISS